MKTQPLVIIIRNLPEMFDTSQIGLLNCSEVINPAVFMKINFLLIYSYTYIVSWHLPFSTTVEWSTAAYDENCQSSLHTIGPAALGLHGNI